MENIEEQLQKCLDQLLELENSMLIMAEDQDIPPYKMRYADGRLILTDVITAKASVLPALQLARQEREKKEAAKKVTDWFANLGKSEE